MSKSFLPVFSSGSFIVSGLTFRSLIHFEFVFVYSRRECTNFILLHVAVQFFQHYLLKRLSLPHYIFLPPLSYINQTYVHGFLFTLLLVSFVVQKQVPFVYFCFYFQYSGRWVIENPAVIYVEECFACFPQGVLQFLVLHLDL